MLWPFVFSICFGQGTFVLSLIVTKPNPNRTAAILLGVIIFIMLITCVDFLFLSSGVWIKAPFVFGISFGHLLLFGPLFFFYSRAITENTFVWKKEYFLHFIPYVAKMLLTIDFYRMSSVLKSEFISRYVAGLLPLRIEEASLFCFQSVHLLVYVCLTLHLIRHRSDEMATVKYLVSIHARLKWLRTLFFCFVAYSGTIATVVVFLIFDRSYSPIYNYIYTLATGLIVVLISYKVSFSPELIAPGFAEKYQFTKRLEPAEQDTIIKTFSSLLRNDKIFRDPGLSLQSVAQKVNIAPHQLSKLINEAYGKSFTELINMHRVQDFIARVNDEQHKSYSLLGLAFESGFSSKSSFNQTFKKITGKTPKEFKPSEN